MSSGALAVVMAENSTAQNELTLRQMVDGISALLVIQTPEGEVEFVNRDHSDTNLSNTTEG